MRPRLILEPILAGGIVHGIIPLLLCAAWPAGASLIVTACGALGALWATVGVRAPRARRGVVVGVTTSAVGVLAAILLAVAWWRLAKPPAAWSDVFAAQPFAFATAIITGGLVGLLQGVSLARAEGTRG